MNKREDEIIQECSAENEIAQSQSRVFLFGNDSDAALTSTQ